MLIQRCAIGDSSPLNVRIVGRRITEIATFLEAEPGETTLEAAGGALLPGLHDHHIHLFALAAAARSIRCGPPTVQSIDDLSHALARHRTADDEWLRGIGYHESVAGDLDRNILDRLVSDRPLRIQHRSGAAWFLNSRAIEVLGLDGAVDSPGVKRGPDGRATGRLFRCDTLLRETVTGEHVPSLREVSKKLAGYGVTGLTDATVSNGKSELRAFTDAADRGELVQKMVMMGARFVPSLDHELIRIGAVKILLDEYALPALADLTREISHAHADDRPVAIHAVTRSEIVLACGALESAGVLAGDRIEHAAVMPPEIAELVARIGATVVTQPGFVRERGDDYLRDVETIDQPWLYRCRGALDAGIALGGSTDAPYGDPDPWLAMQAAVSRRTMAGALLGAGEIVTPERALGLFTSHPDAPGGPPRRLLAGADADLCLLDRPWASARKSFSSAMVRATLCAGQIIYDANNNSS